MSTSNRLDIPEVLRVAKLCPGDRVLLGLAGGCAPALLNGYGDTLREAFPDVLFVFVDADVVQVLGVQEAVQ